MHLREFRWDLVCLMHLAKKSVAINHLLVHDWGPLCVYIYPVQSHCYLHSLQKLVTPGCGLRLNTVSYEKESGLLEEMSGSRSGAGKCKVNLEHLVYQKMRWTPVVVSRGHRIQSK